LVRSYFSFSFKDPFYNAGGTAVGSGSIFVLINRIGLVKPHGKAQKDGRKCLYGSLLHLEDLTPVLRRNS
jgi:hypothetical protein